MVVVCLSHEFSSCFLKLEGGGRWEEGSRAATKGKREGEDPTEIAPRLKQAEDEIDEGNGEIREIKGEGGVEKGLAVRVLFLGAEGGKKSDFGGGD
jgi:hypothetical protein